jgi:ribosomal protein S18 acetylase RimI-like enzyme
VVELSAEVFGEYSSEPAARALAMLREPGAIKLVGEWRGVRAGFAITTVRGESASLDAIAVTELARGRGLGQSLLEAAERAARVRGARRLELVTAESNVAALSLFQRAGFSPGRRLPRHYPRGQHARLFEKLL